MAIFLISDVLGFTSIACWLGAQFPQVLENIKRQSCEGLALPFLANWALGDLSNLIGCILTHQLPFQTLLASYFVFVDFTLLAQYFYYYRRKSPAVPFGRSRSRLSSGSLLRAPSDRIGPRYRTLSAVAANVAAVAALAAQQNEHADPRYTRARIPTGRASIEHPHRSSVSHVSMEAAGEDDDAVPTGMLESFHSDHLPSKRISWSTERLSGRGGSMSRSPMLSRSAIPPSWQITPTDNVAAVPGDVLERGRSLQRDVDNAEHTLTDSPEALRRSSRGASRRGAGMVFLAVWALFNVRTLTGNNLQTISSSRDRTNIGRVLYAKGLSIPDPSQVHVPSSVLPTVIPSPTIVLDIIQFDQQPSYEMPPDDDNRPGQQPSGERILGRIFAWLCTTLYLTSRLPQIWKNFVRKSVEGLSMYLFIFAFFGNVFYVASIVSSPKFSLPPPESTEFIKESIPYLLGSGGTLIFDITIVSQSFIYRPRPSRGRTARRKTIEEEEAGLLTGDALEQPPVSSSTVSQHGLETNESTMQSRGWTSSNDP